MKIIGITGLPCSGKSEAVKIAKKKNIPVVRMGDFVWLEVKKRNLPVNADTVGKVSQEMRQVYGPSIWAKKTVDEINELKNTPLVIIDGIRSMDEILYFRTHLSNSFRLIAITAPDELRHNRAKKRKRIDDSGKKNNMLKRDEREKQWGVVKAIEAADVVIQNDASLKSFHHKVQNLFSDISII